MAREPRDRFETAGEFASAFERSADQKATVTLHAPDIRRAAITTLELQSWVRHFRRPGVRLASASLVVALLFSAMYALWPDSETSIAYGPPLTSLAPSETSTLNQQSEPSVPAPIQQPSARESNAPARHPAAPVPRFATFRIETTETTSVFLDGKPVGIAPGEFRSITPGPHVLMLDAGHGQVHEDTVVATAGSVHMLRYDFPNRPKAFSSELSREPDWGPDGSDTSRARPDAASPRIREWTGSLTDEKCGVSGGKMEELHLDCAQRCIREGKQPMLYSHGRLYRLHGLEKLDLVSEGPLRFKGWLEVDTIHVVGQ